MLVEVFKKLDLWIDTENEERRAEGRLALQRCFIKVVGQTALIEASLTLHVPATMDVDVFANYEYPVKKKFESLLGEIGKVLDPVGHEAWMPKETEFTEYFSGKWLLASLAKPEFVLLSKALKAPKKNKTLLAEYLASEPQEQFFELAKKYEINLDQFLE